MSRHWTEADQAEADVLIWALVEAAFAHRDCAACRRLGRWCEPMGEACEAVLDWRRRRALLSRAQAIRVEHLAAYRAELRRPAS